jgi:NTE family protein
VKINLVLSGGGVRGFAHLGIIKALQENGIDINAISGTSSGAVVGAFIAAGYTPEDTLKIMKEYRLLRLLKGSFSSGIFAMTRFEQIFINCFPHNSFSNLAFPLYISSTNLFTAKTEFFSKGELIPALLASSSMPVLFSPIEINKQLYLDGGILNNLPVEPFLEMRIPIIGSHVNPVNEVQTLTSTLKVMERSFNLAVYANVIHRIKYCNFLFEPTELSSYSVYAYSKANTIYNIGYKYAVSVMDKMNSAIEKQ